ncbi:MAG: hypothetical protein WBQ71_31580 [Trebonia sp.]
MTGAWRLLELLDEFDELEPDEFDELAPLDEFEPEPELADPVPVLAPGLEVEVEVEPLECVDALLVEPGSTAATAPAASRLATPTVAVVVFSLRRPRSRSATARETCRAAPWPRGAPLRSSQLSIIAVWHP